MVSKIEPDRYADTGFSIADTDPVVNEMLFSLMMQRSPEQRLLMGMDMTATAKQLVWASISPELPKRDRRAAFYERFYGEPCPI
jgi:hypothetical protein